MAVGLGAATAITVVPQAAYAQAYSFTTVDVQGNQRVEVGTILSYARITPGQRVSAGELNDAYQRILGSGLFESVELVPQGNTLVVRVVEYPTVNRIAFEGNKRIKDEDLATIVQSQTRRVFSPRVAEDDAQKISEAYVQQGRLAARVTPKVIRRKDNRIDLVFEIFEGGVSEVERIGFVGNTVYSDRRLRRVIDTKQAGILRAIIKKDTFIEDRVAFDKQLLNDFYMARGYVDFRITGVNGELAQERDGYFVTFNVEEGQQFRVGQVTVNSDLPDVDVDRFQRAIKLRSGVVYSPTRVETEIARLEKLAVREGLNFVRVDPRVDRNDRDLTLDVSFDLVRGPRIFVERIDIEGNTTTVDRVIRRQFDTVEGDPFNPRAIRESAERIRALGFFKNVDVNAKEGSTPQQVVVDVNVEEQPTGSLSFGASYSSTGGFGATASFSERNFLGRGQALSFQISSASATKNYGFSFVEPAVFGQDLALGVTVNYSETNNLGSDYDTTSGLFRPFVEFPVSDNGRLQLRYTAGVSEIAAGGSLTGGIIEQEATLGRRVDSSLGYTYTWDTKRAGLSPNNRTLIEFGQDFGGLGGDTNFVKTSAKAVAQTKVWSEEVTLRATVEGGALSYSKGLSRVTDRYQIQPSLMRGFEYGGIGPREVDAAGNSDPLGGNYYAVAKFEAEFPIGLPEEYGISGGLFYDMGSVWGVNSGVSPAPGNTVISSGFDLRHVVGFSVFWDSALGPLRLDFSEPLKKQKQDEAKNFNLTISTQF
ncbi:outer membrane protein assembly factor BamA [Sagittula salina]|uniref:Outer membrane protein assembly factor BamA n=1 Tax=Sagittula salina TaxID=2820268 RepID=A0A940S1F7_9RHOB|nr:outer membrane protein assembly factor BamA [Sagittula salina]MBP0483017.1 outer membrane protein assembly factor BamA [Sagittula salina]